MKKPACVVAFGVMIAFGAYRAQAQEGATIPDASDPSPAVETADPAPRVDLVQQALLAVQGQPAEASHDSKYQPNGTFMSGRATRNMDRLALRRDGDALLVDLSHIIKSDTDPAKWAAATIPG